MLMPWPKLQEEIQATAIIETKLRLTLPYHLKISTRARNSRNSPFSPKAKFSLGFAALLRFPQNRRVWPDKRASGKGWKQGGWFLPTEKQHAAFSAGDAGGSGESSIHCPSGWAPHNPGEHLPLAGDVHTSWMTILVVASTHRVFTHSSKQNQIHNT